MKKQTMFLVILGFIVLIIVIAGQLLVGKQAEVSVSPSTPQALVTLESGSGSGSSPVPTAKIQGDVSVTLDFGNGNVVSEKVYAQNAFMALSQLSSGRGYTVSTKDFKYGRLVEKIDDKANNSSFFWSYRVNGKLGQVASDKYIVHPNDTVEWKYEKVNK